MTVIVAGYEFSSMTYIDFSQPFDDDPETGSTPLQSRSKIANPLVIQAKNACLASGPKPINAFLIGDSVLSSKTTHGSRIVRARKEMKVRDYEIRIGKPDLTVDGRIGQRVIESYTDSCGLAYSGDNLFFTSVESKFSKEMRALRYTYRYSEQENGGKYAISLPYESDAYDADSFRFDSSITFASVLLPKLKACIVAELLAKCTQDVIDDIFGEKLNRGENIEKKDFTEFALTVYCRSSDRPVLFHVDIVSDLSVSPPWLKVRTRKIADDDLLVLGQKSWKSNFVQSRSNAVSGRSSIQSALIGTCGSLVSAAASGNYVGGEIVSGTTDSYGFRNGSSSIW